MNEMETFSVRDQAGNWESVQTRQHERSRKVRRLSEMRVEVKRGRCA